MKVKSTVDINTNVDISVIDAKTGRTVSKESVHNLVVLTGRTLICDLLAGNDNYLSHFGVGTSTAGSTASTTTLGAQVVRVEITKMTASTGTLTVSQYIGSGEGNGSTLREAGLFNGATTNDTMFARALHSAITKTSSVAVVYSWTVTVAAST